MSDGQRQSLEGTGKAVDAVRDSVRFLARFAVEPLEQASGMLTDHLKHVRWERQVRLKERAQKFMRERGLNGPTKGVPLKVLVPLIEAASLEEDDYLQDVWAQLLANAADANSGVNVQRAFISMLEDFGPLEARCLETLCRPEGVPDESFHFAGNPTLVTAELPARAVVQQKDTEYGVPSDEVKIALWNLARLGCLSPGMFWSGLGVSLVNLTPLGRALHRACSSGGRENICS